MMNFPGVIAGDPDVLARMVAPHVDGHAPGVHRARAGRLRRGGHRLRPRGVHGRRGAGEAPARHVGADPRGLERAQPERPAGDGARARARTTARSAPTTASRTSCCREGHIDQMCRLAVARGHRRRGRAGDGDAARRARARAARPRRDRARATSPTSCCSRTSTTFRPSRGAARTARVARDAGRAVRGPRCRSCATRCAPRRSAVRPPRRRRTRGARDRDRSPGS